MCQAAAPTGRARPAGSSGGTGPLIYGSADQAASPATRQTFNLHGDPRSAVTPSPNAFDPEMSSPDPLSLPATRPPAYVTHGDPGGPDGIGGPTTPPAAPPAAPPVTPPAVAPPSTPARASWDPTRVPGSGYQANYGAGIQNFNPAQMAQQYGTKQITADQVQGLTAQMTREQRQQFFHEMGQYYKNDPMNPGSSFAAQQRYRSGQTANPGVNPLLRQAMVNAVLRRRG